MNETAIQSRGNLLGHPPALFVLFATEMWERFSFYGMRALLVLYLVKHFLYSDDVAAGIFGAYVGLTYALPVLGGLFADRYLGARRAVVYGGIMLCIGHFTMAWEGMPSTVDQATGAVTRDATGEWALFLALSLIATGVGFLKPNISTLVGSLYPIEDKRRDSGFTLFYMGINLGAFLSFLIVGTIGETYGWGYGFGLAGLGMIVGLTIFLWGQKYLDGAGDAPDLKLLQTPVFGVLSREHLIYLSGLVMVLCSLFLVQSQEVVGGGLVLTLLAAYGYVLYQGVRHCTKEEASRLIVVLVLTFFSVVFWALFEQAGTSINLFTDRVVNRQLGDFEFKTSNFQSLNPGFILLLGPVFSALWIWLAGRNWEPSLPQKFAMGIGLVGLGFIPLLIGISLAAAGDKVGMIWIVFAYLLHTMGELCLSPVGLSMVTRLTVARMVGLMMGCWFLATAFAGWLSGQLAQLASIDYEILKQGDTGVMVDIYSSLFLKLGVAGIAIALLLLALSPLLKRFQAGN